MDPEVRTVLAAVPALRGRTVSVTPLDGGLSNRSYHIDAHGESFVLRIAAPDSEAPTEQRQFTGCTSDRTLITFTVPSPEVHKGNSRIQAEVSVLDDTGGLLTHSVAPIPIR